MEIKRYRQDIQLWEETVLKDTYVMYIYYVFKDSKLTKFKLLKRKYKKDTCKYFKFRIMNRIHVSKQELLEKYKDNKYSIPNEYGIEN